MKVKGLFLFILFGGILLLTTVGCVLFYPPTVYEHFVSPQEASNFVATPTFDPSGGTYTNVQSVHISCATSGAIIYYTLDGTSPTPSNPVFTTNISVFSNNTTIKAIAVKSNMANSQVATATYTFVGVASPTFSPPADTYNNAQSVHISCATPGAEIYYTLDGTPPTSSNTLFTSNIVISNNTTIKAIAVKSGMEYSQVATATYFFFTWQIYNMNEVTITGTLGNPSSLVIPSVIHGNPVISIGDSAFESCTGLTNVIFSTNLTSIAGNAFLRCTGLTNVTLPNSLTSIGDYAFSDCANLIKVTVQATNPPSLGWQAFDGNASNRMIYVPSGSLSNYLTNAQWSYYSNYIVGY